MWLQTTTSELGPDNKFKNTYKEEEIPRNSTNEYLILTGNYTATGGDQYDIFKKQKLVLDEENGKFKTALIRQFLLGEF